MATIPDIKVDIYLINSGIMDISAARRGLGALVLHAARRLLKSELRIEEKTGETIFSLERDRDGKVLIHNEKAEIYLEKFDQKINGDMVIEIRIPGFEPGLVRR